MPNNGYVTPSQFSKVMSNGRGKDTFGKTAMTYADEIVLDLLGVKREEITAPALEWGINLETVARERYESETFNSVSVPESALFHQSVEYVCGTPDGLVGSKGIIEIKCPYNSLNHLNNITDGAQIDDYNYQIQGYLWITGREWCDFVSFDPRFPTEMQIAIHRVERDQEVIEQLEARIKDFWDIVQTKYQSILKR